MAEFIRSNIIDAHTMATEVFTEDLPINPISHLILTIEGTNEEATEVTIAQILAFINLITVRHIGIQILNLQAEDLANLNLYLFGSGGQALAPEATDTQHMAYSLIIPFGRKLFDPEECFPASRKGEFQITLDTTIPATTFVNAVLSLSAVELPEATPARHLISTLFSISAPGAAGESDIDLPIGNDLLAVLIRMTSFAGAAEFLFGINDIRLLVDNRETGIVSAKAPELLGEMISRAPGTIRSTPLQGGLIPNTCTWMDFDPTRDGTYMIDTRGKSRVHLRANYGVNEAVLIAPLELRTI
ncbi:hypothetical protein ES703_41477 [subsurface metagenome]|nr:hypothetical protein [Dehalococcoidia bacterium]